MRTSRRRRLGLLLLPFLVLALGFSKESALQLSVDTIEVNLQPEVASRVGAPWMASSNYVSVRIDTRSLRGRAWRLWIAPRGLSGGNPTVPPQVIRWEVRTPFVNGTLLPQQRVLAGQGAVDGQVVQDNFIFFARGEATGAGIFTLPLEFILEVVQ
ncbi:MAG: hypothetical protein FJ121_11120 [Deltaproteobacteria bacterium]|nr:hypothetical protein [Deltaproteobacteria bacterium]